MSSDPRWDEYRAERKFPLELHEHPETQDPRLPTLAPTRRVAAWDRMRMTAGRPRLQHNR